MGVREGGSEAVPAVLEPPLHGRREDRARESERERERGREKLRSISCEDGTHLFLGYSSHVAVSADGTDSEDRLTRNCASAYDLSKVEGCSSTLALLWMR